jgi:hypothetical protein
MGSIDLVLILLYNLYWAPLGSVDCPRGETESKITFKILLLQLLSKVIFLFTVINETRANPS